VNHPLDGLPPSSGLGLVAAVGREGAIGRAGALPWHAPEDLAHFKRLTTGHRVIVGATTWASIGRVLPGRHFVVVSRRRLDLPEGVVLTSDPDEALAVARAADPAPLLAGGAQLYEALLTHVERAYLTDVDEAVPDADAFFPTLDADEWDEVACWPGDDPRLQFRVLDRRRPAGSGA
jgi:dihydrofolate reductase